MLLDYVTHINVADGNDLLDKIRQFAVSKGWTQEEWQPQMEWSGSGSSYGFVSDTDCAFLCLSTTGYGTTPIVVKLYLGFGTRTTLMTSVGGLYIFPCLCSDASVVYTSSIPPNGHHAISTPYPNSQPGYYTAAISGLNVSLTETINQVWIFGDDKWICAVVNYDGYNCHQIHFGQFEMFEANPSQGMVMGWTAQFRADVLNTYLMHYTNAASTVACAWFRKTGGLGSAGTTDPGNGDLCYSDDGSSPFGTIKYGTDDDDLLLSNLYPSSIGSAREMAYAADLGKGGFNLERAIQLNSYGSARMMAKIVYFVRSRIDSTYIPLCKSSIYLTRFDNLSIGEILDYGTEQYMFFPLAHVSDTWGIAFRIT